jgi:hypothetical protein
MSCLHNGRVWYDHLEVGQEERIIMRLGMAITMTVQRDIPQEAIATSLLQRAAKLERKASVVNNQICSLRSVIQAELLTAYSDLHGPHNATDAIPIL